MNWQREATGVAGRQRVMSLLCLLMAQMSFQHREIAAAEDHLAPFVLSCNSRGCNIGPRGYIMISTVVHHWLFFGWHGFPIDSIMYLLNPLTGVSSVFCFFLCLFLFYLGLSKISGCYSIGYLICNAICEMQSYVKIILLMQTGQRFIWFNVASLDWCAIYIHGLNFRR